jgi:hypothetical protein
MLLMEERKQACHLDAGVTWAEGGQRGRGSPTTHFITDKGQDARQTWLFRVAYSCVKAAVKGTETVNDIMS